MLCALRSLGRIELRKGGRVGLGLARASQLPLGLGDGVCSSVGPAGRGQAQRHAHRRLLQCSLALADGALQQRAVCLYTGTVGLQGWLMAHIPCFPERAESDVSSFALVSRDIGQQFVMSLASLQWLPVLRLALACPSLSMLLVMVVALRTRRLSSVLRSRCA